MRRGLTVILLAGGLAACAAVDTRAQRQAQLAPLVGQDEAALVRRLGVPSRTYETGGAKFLAYDERSTHVVPGAPLYSPGWYGWYEGGMPPEVIERRCETTFEVTGGVVRGFTFRGNAC